MSDTRPKAWLVIYDIRKDRRRRKVFDVLRGFGDHVQYSVFRCVVSPEAYVRMEAEVAAFIHHRDDQVMFVPLGDPVHGKMPEVRFLGVPWERPETVVRIVG